ncbi:MAG: hypothetical protein ABJE95_01225 [Byssovorax sp.]
MLRRILASFALALAACSNVAPPAPPLGEPAPRAPSVASAPPVVAAAAFTPLAAPTECADSPAIAVFAAPLAPRVGAPLRILAVASAPLDAALVVHDPSGAPVVVATERHGAAPFWWYAELPAAAVGEYRVVLQRVGDAEASPIAACRTLSVEVDPAPPKRTAWSAAWGVRAAWTEAYENLYSAWIEKLFDAPLAEQPAWPALQEVLHDRARNFLHDDRGEGEDDDGQGAPVLQPDCADLPYFLRGYFAFKLGLPFAYSTCTRGGWGSPPTCSHRRSNLNPVPQRTSAVSTFTDFLRITVANTVHSGTGRAPAEDDGGDYYPIRLSFEGLRPGTIYADPYGHILVVAKRIPQTAESGGVLLAVDGQPDGTVARKRFWAGNFLFAVDPALGSAGFKRFRPLVIDHAQVKALSNAEIAAAPVYGDFALDQYAAGATGFYDRMDDVLSPSPLDPATAMLERVQALDEQVRARVLSVQNGQKHFAGGHGARIAMPKGATIFETDGDWEDFSTPSRDLRLLIAVDLVQGFPALVARRPARFAMPTGKSVTDLEGELDALLDAELHKRSVSYARSDGAPFTITLADVVARAPDLEVAYNPNDCPEVRWGAPAGSAEIATCKRRAPAGQAAQMRAVRPWFHDRKRPPRG